MMILNMRYPAGYKEQKRQELLLSSAQLAKKQGFAATGIDGFMQAANMTSGAFYSHFSSKQDLFKALVESELQHSVQRWENNPHTQPAAWIQFELDRYLNIMHVQHPENGCLLPALAGEIGHANEDIKSACQQELMRGHALFSKHLNSEEKAWAMISQLVGAVLVARAMTDPALQQMILSSNKTVMLNLLKNT